MKRFFLSFITLLYIYLSVFCLKAGAETQQNDIELFFKSDALLEDCLRYVALKDKENAKKTLETAYKIADAIEDSYSREIILNEIVNKYLLMDEDEKALQVANYLRYIDVRSEAFAQIAFRATELENFDLVRKIIKNINEPFSKAKTFYKIVNKLTYQERYEEALKFTREAVETQIFMDEFLSAEYLERTLLNEEYNFSFIDQEAITLAKPVELYSKSVKLSEVSDEYLNLYLFGLAKQLLVRATTIAGKINPPLLRHDALKKIAAVNEKREKLEKIFRIR